MLGLLLGLRRCKHVRAGLQPCYCPSRLGELAIRRSLLEPEGRCMLSLQALAEGKPEHARLQYVWQQYHIMFANTTMSSSAAARQSVPPLRFILFAMRRC